MRPKPATRCAERDVETMEAEIGEVGIDAASSWRARNRRRSTGSSSRPPTRADQRQAGAGERVAALAAGGDQKERGALVAREVPGVHGEGGKKKDRLALAGVLATVTSEAKGEPSSPSVANEPVDARRSTRRAVSGPRIPSDRSSSSPGRVNSRQDRKIRSPLKGLIRRPNGP